MQHQAFQLDAVLLRKSQRALEHGILHDVQNFGIIDGLVDVFAALVTAQIRAGRVAHVVDVQLTLDVEIKRLERNHVRNFRDFTLERGLIDLKLKDMDFEMSLDEQYNYIMRRWYDKNIRVSHAMEYLKHAPEEIQRQLALDIIEYIEQNSDENSIS